MDGKESPIVPRWEQLNIEENDKAEPLDAESTHDGIPPEDEVG